MYEIAVDENIKHDAREWKKHKCGTDAHDVSRTGQVTTNYWHVASAKMQSSVSYFLIILNVGMY